MSRSLATVLAGLVIIAAIIKLLREDLKSDDSRVAATGNRIRATAADRVTDPRAEMLNSVDAAISSAAAEMSGPSMRRQPSGDVPDA